MADLRLYNRDVMVAVLVVHQRHRPDACLCGWSELGKSHAEHIASEYEKFIDTVATIVVNVRIPDYLVTGTDDQRQEFIKRELADIKTQLANRGEEFFGTIDLSLPGCTNPMEPEQEYLKIVYSYRSV